MAQLISEIWEGLRNAGLPEVMLYLPDNSASRCHWDDTALVGGVRVALLADQDRQIVRILPVDSCVGIGIASPKGTDPCGYKREVFNKLTHSPGDGDDEAAGALYDANSPLDVTPAEPPLPVAPMPIVLVPPPPPAFVEPPPKANPLTSRFGVAMKSAPSARYPIR
jgi:hypothetical protein